MKQHVMERGDSVAYLARIYKVTTDAILAANPGVECRYMRIGQSINIPEPVSVAKPAAPQGSPLITSK